MWDKNLIIGSCFFGLLRFQKQLKGGNNPKSTYMQVETMSYLLAWVQKRIANGPFHRKVING